MIAGLKPYPAMKDSGVPSLGDVPTHWCVTRVGRIGRLLKGVGGTKEDATETGVPCVRYGDLYTTHKYFVREARSRIAVARTPDYTEIRFGDALFAASGETIEDIGKSAVNLIDGPAFCGGDVIVLRPTIPFHAPFLGYAADSRPSVVQKATMARGTTIKHVYPDQLKWLFLCLPPVPEQAAIVRFLDHADRQIRRYIIAKQKLIKLLEEQKQAIIHRAVTRGLAQGVHLKPSGVEWLGDVPVHWDVCRVKHVARLESGHTPSRSNPLHWLGDNEIPGYLSMTPGRWTRATTSPTPSTGSTPLGCRTPRRGCCPVAWSCLPVMRPSERQRLPRGRWQSLSTSLLGSVDRKS